MRQNLLLCDIGNTSIKLGVSCKDGIIAHWTLPTARNLTSDSLGLDIRAALASANISADSFEACAAASVVPALNPVLRRAVSIYLGCPCLFAPGDLPVPLENRYLRPAEVGADRLVGAWAARILNPNAHSLIVVDYGTAVTFDCVSDNAYLGGLIFPGPQTATQALASNTSRLPYVSLDMEACELSPGRDTATSIQQGIVFGFVSVTEGLCGRLAPQLPQPLRIIATGGFAESVARFTTIFDEVCPALLLDGLRYLYAERGA